MMRLFVAVRPGGETLDAIRELQDKLRGSGTLGNYIPADALHITLAFIGEVSDPVPVIAALKDLSGCGFTVQIDTTGHYGDLWWAGPASDSEALRGLAEDVRERLALAGVGFDRKPFRPHITFLRRAHRMPDGIGIKRTRTHVTRVSLIRSERIGRRMQYTELFGLDLS